MTDLWSFNLELCCAISDQCVNVFVSFDLSADFNDIHFLFDFAQTLFMLYQSHLTFHFSFNPVSIS